MMELYGLVSWTKETGFEIREMSVDESAMIKRLENITPRPSIPDWRVFRFKPEQMIARSEFIEERFEEYHAGAKELARRIEDREQCKEFISNDWSRHRCERKAKIEGYCKQHYKVNQRRGK